MIRNCTKMCFFFKKIETDAKRTIQTPKSTINERFSIFVEVWWNFAKMTMVKMAKFHQISMKIEDFSIMVLFGVCIVRFASVFTLTLDRDNSCFSKLFARCIYRLILCLLTYRVFHLKIRNFKLSLTQNLFIFDPKFSN